MNQLQYEKSPYLLQHAENPVDWRPWGAAAFAAAQKKDKPVFLSIGYSTCHWCHVMAHESFESEEVAGLINREYIPVKVDREERPDVDAVYMAACIAMNGSGGWPLTVLLTPDQKPFWAGTYLPKAQLLSLLRQAAGLWKDNRDDVLAAGEAMTEHLRQEEEFQPETPGRALAEAGVSSFSRLFDAQWGGFGRAPKFPTPHNLLFLLRYARLTHHAHAREMAEQTLEHMYRGGIFDHVGGGFSRYSTDRQWLTPHFEKMLYDNALLSMAYAEAWQQTHRPYYRQVACRTLDYVLAELRDPMGGFYCGQDADSEGAEGKNYVFSPDELADVLGKEDAARFCRRFGVTERGNFEGKNILHLMHTADWEQQPDDMPAMLKKVADYRRGRTALHRDDKVLTAWNGLMIAAFARAGLIFDEPNYQNAAAQAADFIEHNLRDEHGRLLARWRDGDAAHAGKLDDYAFYAWGLLELYGASFRIPYLETACRLAEELLAHFFDRETGGLFPYAADGEQLITRRKEVYDGAMPSGNAVAALVFSRLSRLTGEEKWREAETLQFAYLTGAIRQYPAGHSFTLLALLEKLWPTQELVCAAKQVPEELLAFVRQATRPGLTVLAKTEENANALSALAPFTAAYPVPPSGAQYYLCQNGSCKSPVETVAELDGMQENA